MSNGTYKGNDTLPWNSCQASVCQVSVCHAQKALPKKVGAISQIESQYMYFTILQMDMPDIKFVAWSKYPKFNFLQEMGTNHNLFGNMIWLTTWENSE